MPARFLLLAALLAPSLLLAQNVLPSMPQLPRVRSISQGNENASGALAENYAVTLTCTGEDGKPVELSMVVASPDFTASLPEQGLSFAGGIAVQEGGELLFRYTLGWETAVSVQGNQQYRTSSAQGSVRLKLGEQVQILKAGARTTLLVVKKAEPARAK